MYGLYLKNALKTVTTHKGTKIEQLFPKAARLSDDFKIMIKSKELPENPQRAMFDAISDKGKLFTFAQNSSLKKMGIDQAILGQDTYSGAKILSLWQEGNLVKSELLTPDKIKDFRNYFRVLKELIETGFKLPI